jgi:integrating conjugative element protein (TIGR03758 family)
MDAAFTTGAGVEPSALLLAIAAGILTLLTLWVAWVAYGQLRSWRAGYGTLYDLVWTVMRASLLLLVLGFFIR